MKPGDDMHGARPGRTDPAAASPSQVTVEVVLGAPGAAQVIELAVRRGAAIRQVIEQSGLAARHPEIDLDDCAVGVFGRRRELHEAVRDGDRIEIYQPLLMDPREARRRRARR